MWKIVLGFNCKIFTFFNWVNNCYDFTIFCWSEKLKPCEEPIIGRSTKTYRRKIIALTAKIYRLKNFSKETIISANFYISSNLWIYSKDFFETLYHNEEQEVEKNSISEISQNTLILGQLSKFVPILAGNWYLTFLNWL